MQTWGEKERAGRIEKVNTEIYIYMKPCVKWIASGKLLYKHRELSLVLCDDLEE